MDYWWGHRRFYRMDYWWAQMFLPHGLLVGTDTGGHRHWWAQTDYWWAQTWSRRGHRYGAGVGTDMEQVWAQTWSGRGHRHGHRHGAGVGTDMGTHMHKASETQILCVLP